jgi:hypothetical protein
MKKAVDIPNKFPPPAFWISRGVALGMNDLSSVSGEWRTLLAVFLGNHLEDSVEFGKGFGPRAGEGSLPRPGPFEGPAS